MSEPAPSAPGRPAALQATGYLLAEAATQAELAFRAVNFDERRFPEIATHVLAQAALHTKVGVTDLIEQAVCHLPLPSQDLQANFGQPPLVVYRSDHLCLQVLFWLDSTTAIHQHAFSGAFQVLSGGSIHTTYDFTVSQRINSRMCAGKATYLQCEHLRTGDIRPIHAGNHLIHALFHLESPSVSLVLRTLHEPEHQPQLLVRMPSFAVDPFHRLERAGRRLELLEVLLETDLEAYERVAAIALASSDFEFGFHAVERCYAKLHGHPTYGRLLGVLRDRHGALADRVDEMCRFEARERWFLNRRRAVRDPAHRFLLALLLNVPRRADILRIVGDSYPGPAADTVSRWLAELATKPAAIPGEPNALGITFDEASLGLLGAFAKGQCFEQALVDLRAQFDGVDDSRNALQQIWAAIGDSLIFKPLQA